MNNGMKKNRPPQISANKLVLEDKPKNIAPPPIIMNIEQNTIMKIFDAV